MSLNPFARKKSSRRSYATTGSSGFLSGETKSAIVGVIFMFLAALILLSFFSAAGVAGEKLLGVLRSGVGTLTYFFPFLLIAWGIYLVRPREEGMPLLKKVGIVLMVLGLLGCLHLMGISSEDAYQAALDGHGGGLLGFFLSFPLTKAFSPIASLLIFAMALVVGVFLTFNLSPGQVWAWLKSLIPGKEAGEDGEGEDSAEDEVEGTAALPTFRINKVRLGGKDGDPRQLALQVPPKEEDQKQRLAQQI